MLFQYNLLPKQKHRKNGLNVQIDLYELATDLYNELDRLGIMERTRKIPQLGLIRVNRNLNKSRYDYIMLQLYFHQLIKSPLSPVLKFSYNNYIAQNEFLPNSIFFSGKKITIADVMQILTIVYNVGHFKNTFVSSNAVVMLGEENNTFKNALIHCSSSVHYRTAVENIIKKGDYSRLHLINSLLILEKCDQQKFSVQVAKNILYAYLFPENLKEDSKLQYAFELFRNVRNVSYIAYDLQIAPTPFTLDLWNDKAVILLFRELLSSFNDQTAAHNLVTSVSKLLHDTVYNESVNAICYYKISRKMVKDFSDMVDYSNFDYYNNYFLNEESCFNKEYRQTKDYSEYGILKMTFASNENAVYRDLLFGLKHTNCACVGAYNRHSGEKTILISIKKNSNDKAKTALRITKQIIGALRKIDNISCTDMRYILTVKFLLFYLFNEHQIIIKPTVDEKICAVCTRGKNSRISVLKSILKKEVGKVDERHELNFMIDRLESDVINDTTITVPASILVYAVDNLGKPICEFDGIIIHPMRTENQVVFLEAKNRKDSASYGKQCLKKKLRKLQIPFNADDIIISNRDAYWNMTI